MTIPTEPRTNSLYHASEPAAARVRDSGVFSAGHAAIVLLVSFGGYLVVAPMLATAGAALLLVVVAGEAVIVAVPIVFMRLARGGVAMIGLRRPAMRFVVAALLIGSSQWFVILVIVDRLDNWLDLSRDGSIDRLAKVAIDPPLLVSLFAIALVPAVCEEILFRGVLARGLATRLVPSVAIVVSAVLFSVFHLSLVQAAPTFLLGLAYGYLALAARSCVPTIVAHLVNNSLAILVAQDAIPGLADAIGYNTVVSASIALALMSSGLVLALRGRA
jgi:membrane protease YdiL (CAAX protease family)